MVEKLLEEGADKDPRSVWGHTPMQEAVANKQGPGVRVSACVRACMHVRVCLSIRVLSQQCVHARVRVRVMWLLKCMLCPQ